MKDLLHLALIDDNPDDRALVVRELQRSLPNLQISEVTDAPTLTRVLSSSPQDLVITDFQLHWTDGLAVLRNVKSHWPDCPVIMFTGTGNEEVAVRAMKAGVEDYVLKSPQQFARLPSVARRCVQVAQQRHQLRQAEARYSVLFASVPVGLYRATAQGNLLDANPALVEMLRFPNKGALLARTLADLHADAGSYQQWQQRMQASGLVHRYEARLRTFDAQSCWVQNSARAIRETRGGQWVYEGSVENIQERKLAEEEREHLILDLQEALTKVRTLSGLLPICAACKKIRDDDGYWKQIEEYIQTHSDAEFTHSFCPECMRTLYPEAFPGTVS